MKAVNLIPSEQRATGKGPVVPAAKPSSGESPLGAYVILAALVFAIAAVALLVTTKNGINDKKTELAQVQQEATVVKQQATALQSYADFHQLASSRAATVRGLVDARFPWSSTLDDVSRALPTDVYISSFDGATGSSSGGSEIRSAIAAPSIELNGCTKDQSSVARLMSRLRDVRGVTRVTLDKSEVTETAGAATAPAPAPAADGTTPAVTTEPCPKGAPPAFDLVVFFERAAADPNAATNPSAAISAGPTGATGPTGSSGATTPAASTSTTTQP